MAGHLEACEEGHCCRVCIIYKHQFKLSGAIPSFFEPIKKGECQVNAGHVDLDHVFSGCHKTLFCGHHLLLVGMVPLEVVA